MVPDADLAGIKTNAVNGSYTPVEALRLMLANKGLEVVESPNGAVVIRRAGQPGQVAATPEGGGADIVVTGSRILRTGFDTLQSATVTDREQIERQAYTNAIEALRSEEHTSELQSLMRITYAVFCLKKKKNNK